MYSYYIMSNSPFYISETHKEVFIYSPKCACTILQIHFIKHRWEQVCNMDVRKFAAQNGYIKHDYRSIPSEYKIFWGVRNPYDRIISSYINKFIYYNGKLLNETTLEPFADNLLKQINVTHSELTFNKFLDGINMLMQNGRRIDPHFNQQVNVNALSQIRDHPQLTVFDIDDIPSVFPDFNSGRTNVTPYNENGTYIDVADYTPDQFTKDLYRKENFKSAITKIKQIYKVDYDIYNSIAILNEDDKRV